MADEGDGENPFLKRREELVKIARLERERVDTEAEQERQRLDKEAEQERQRLAQLRKQNLSNAKKYLVEDIELVLDNLRTNPLLLEKSGTQSFISEAFESFRYGEKTPHYECRTKIVTMDYKGDISLLNVENGDIISHFSSELDPSDIQGASISSDSELIAIYDGNMTFIWNILTGKKIKTFLGLRSSIFIPNTQNLVTILARKTPGTQECAVMCAKTGEMLSNVKFENEISSLVIDSTGCGVFIIQKLKLRPYLVDHVRLNPPNSSHLAGLSRRNLLRIKNNTIRDFQGSDNMFVWCVSGRNGLDRKWKTDDGEFTQTFPIKTDHEYCSLSISPCGKEIATCNLRGAISTFNSRTGTLTNHVKNQYLERQVDYSPCGKFISVFGNKRITVLDAKNLRKTNELRAKFLGMATSFRFIDQELNLVLQNVRRMANSADFSLHTEDGSNFTLSWNGIIE